MEIRTEELRNENRNRGMEIRIKECKTIRVVRRGKSEKSDVPSTTINEWKLTTNLLPHHKKRNQDQQSLRNRSSQPHPP
jgi:hypothetical protein